MWDDETRELLKGRAALIRMPYGRIAGLNKNKRGLHIHRFMRVNEHTYIKHGRISVDEYLDEFERWKEKIKKTMKVREVEYRWIGPRP